MKKLDMLYFTIANFVILYLSYVAIKPAFYKIDASFVQFGLPASQNIELYGNIAIGFVTLFVGILLLSLLFTKIKNKKNSILN